MTSAERLDAILKIIEKKKYCTVKYLADVFSVSHMTIRRDLKVLFDKGKILRCRGGAGEIKFDESAAPAFSIRELQGLDLKRKIAAKAAKVLKPGSSIFIDHSSTVLPLLKYITPESCITVVTNGLRALSELSVKKIKLYCTGGEFHSLEQAYFGENAIKTINMMHFDAAFISPAGIISNDAAYGSSEHEAELLKAAMNNSDNVYALLSINKIGARFKYKMCDLTEFTEIFTNTDYDKKTLTQ